MVGMNNKMEKIKAIEETSKKYDIPCPVCDSDNTGIEPTCGNRICYDCKHEW